MLFLFLFILLGRFVQLWSAPAAFILTRSNETRFGEASRQLQGDESHSDVSAGSAGNVRIHVPAEKSHHEWRKKALYSINLEAECNAQRDKYLSEATAQSLEDVWLFERWFYGMENGVIVESGALDGIKYSTSHVFDVVAGWTAVHVEADPGSYKQLLNNRPASINVHAALCGESKVLHYVSRGAGSPVNGFVEFMPERFLRKFHNSLYSDPSLVDSLPTVQCLTAKKLFSMLKLQHIDIWVLDVEGAEESVLQGTDFNAVHINAVAMECDGLDKERDTRKMAILEANGFTCELVVRNCMCKHNDFSDIHIAPVLSDAYPK